MGPRPGPCPCWGSHSPVSHSGHSLGAQGLLAAQGLGRSGREFQAAHEACEGGSAPQKQARSLGRVLPGQVPDR